MYDFWDWLIIAGLFTAMVGGYAWHRRRLIRTGRTWRKLAQFHGGKLEHNGTGWLTEPDYELRCTFGGTPLKLGYHITSSGRTSTYWTQIEIPMDTALTLEIISEGLINKIGKKLGLEDIETGDAEYDRRFLISSSDPMRFLRLCSREFRRAHAKHADVRIFTRDGTLCLRRRGLSSGLTETQELIDFALLSHATFDRNSSG